MKRITWLMCELAAKDIYTKASRVYTTTGVLPALDVFEVKLLIDLCQNNGIAWRDYE